MIYRCDGRVPIGQPPTCNSNIPRQTLTYFGLELEKNGNTHYGWVEVSSFVSLFNDIEIHSWGYETEPNKPILAGAIPEPSSILLLSLSFPILLRRQR